MLMTTTFALVFVTIGLPQAASAATPITCGGPPITESGEYFLKEDCPVDNFKNAIDIQASKVQLNMRGHTISGAIKTPSDCEVPPPPGRDVGIGISVGGSDVEIRNGAVIHLNIGIQFKEGHDNHAHNLTVTGNCLGIQVFNSDNNQINGNNVSGNFTNGLELNHANNNAVISNVVNNNGVKCCGASGIRLDTSSGNLIESNKIFANLTTGLRLAHSNNNFILDNKVNGMLSTKMWTSRGGSESTAM